MPEYNIQSIFDDYSNGFIHYTPMSIILDDVVCGITYTGYAGATVADAIYDYTFVGRYDVLHRNQKNMYEYIALDRHTGLTSLIAECSAPITEHDYPLILPALYRAIKYTGDKRYALVRQHSPTDLIDVILRSIIPAYGIDITERQILLAKSIFKSIMGNPNRYDDLCAVRSIEYIIARYVVELFEMRTYIGYVSPYITSICREGDHP